MSAINSGPSDRFKTHARQHYVGIRSKKVLISVITDDELVIGIVERKTLRNRFNRVSEVRSRCGLLLSRLRQLAGKKGDLLLQIGKRGAASARGRWRVAALQPRRFAVLRFRGFPAYCATPSHVALPVAEPLTYHIVRVVVPHSKIDRSCRVGSCVTSIAGPNGVAQLYSAIAFAFHRYQEPANQGDIWSFSSRGCCCPPFKGRHPW